MESSSWIASRTLASRRGIRSDIRSDRDPRRRRGALPDGSPASTGASSTASSAYPDEFVAGADRGRLARRADPRGVRRQRPRHHRRRADPRGDQPRSGGNARRLPRADVHHGHAPAARLATSRSSATCPTIASGELRLQAFGVTEPTPAPTRRACSTTRRAPGRRQLRSSTARRSGPRASQHSDLHAAAGAHDAARPGEDKTDGLSVVPRRPARRRAATAIDDPADPHDDQPRHDRALHRRPRGAGGEPDRRGGQGLPLHPRRHERRAHPDRRRVRSATAAGSSSARAPYAQRARRLRPADRPEPGRPVPASPAPTPRPRRPI